MSDSLLLSDEEKDRIEYKRIISKTVEAILSSFSDESAFSGIDPYSLRKEIASCSSFEAKGIGFDSTLDIVKKNIMPNLLRTWSNEYMPHLHSPALLESIASELIIASFNDSMDSWDQGPAATELEESVIKELCSLFGYNNSSDGVFTSGGSQSNLSAITAHRDMFCKKTLGYDVKKHGLPDCYGKLRLYTSSISHFSMEKSCHMLGLGYDAVVKLPVDSSFKIDIERFRNIVKEDKAKGLIPFSAVATIGTTDFGSIDDVKAMREICDEYGMYLHADAAYGSGLIMSKNYRYRLGPLSLCDSITVDFHKMFLLPISCSAILVKDKESLDCFELHADYLNREEDEEEGYINLVGKSIQTTRRFDALKVFMAFKTRGIDGFGEIMDKLVGNAEYFYSRISNDSFFQVAVKPEISSVVFRVNGTNELNKKIRKSLLSDGIVIGQTSSNGMTMLKFTLLNPRLDFKTIDSLIDTIREKANLLK